MKCPERFITVQRNLRKSITDEESVYSREYHILLENQMFEECYKENCAAWDVEKQRCREF